LTELSEHKKIILAALKEVRKAEVRVFCPKCREGNNVIWKGKLTEWALLMGLPEDTPVPEWAEYAWRHQHAHGHTIMVEYPNRCVPMFGSLKVKSR
jgi:hypothetical protein